ncbi:hypothetical protein OG762_28960 [Streptomyces sp. NBC_01136]|uniref:hypothetical protein n=1 Tax=Streptomyces sp. NBC_01136 TaxID=2903754 RepID=UPI003862E7CC|nr:hypothetical protein OG762_28960 [Streptomyces sp. NBC_01136]
MTDVMSCLVLVDPFGVVAEGAGAACGADAEGGTCTACGHTDGYFWISINYQGIKGYTALYCITRP